MKVAIIGAGLAGSTLAKILSNNGFKVDLYEYRKQPKAICAGGLGKPAFLLVREILEKVYGTKVAHKLLAESIKSCIKRVVIETHNAKLELSSKDFNTLYLGYILDRKVFDKLLFQEVVKEVNLIRKRVTPIDINNYDIIIDARGSEAWEPKVLGNDATISYQWHAMGSFEPETLTISFYPELSRSGYFWIFPWSSREAKVGFVISKAEMSMAPDFYLTAYAASKRLNIATIEYKEGSILPLGKPKTEYLYDAPNIFRVGTAAMIIDPLTGAGIKYAFLSAYKLGKCIIEYRNILAIRDCYLRAMRPTIRTLRILYAIKKYITRFDVQEWTKLINTLKSYTPKTLVLEKEIVKAMLCLLKKYPGLLLKIISTLLL